jgi:hypothetical protein
MATNCRTGRVKTRTATTAARQIQANNLKNDVTRKGDAKIGLLTFAAGILFR